jgi:hypothetical protein
MNKQEYNNQINTLSQALEPFDSNQADSNYLVLDELFSIVYKSGVLDITHLPKIEQDQYKFELFTMLTQHSGTLAFLVIQILAAHNIMSKHNYPKKEYYFTKKCGIAINHLRAPKTIVSAHKVEGGYALNGILTWASGYQIFDTLLIGFHYEGSELEAMAPFAMQEGFDIGSADETFVGYGLNTVNIELKDYFVAEDAIVSSNPIGNYTKNKSASKTVHFCLYGVGEAAVNYIKDQEFKNRVHEKLLILKDKILESNDIDELDSLRIELFNIVHQGITTGMILNGGSSILMSEPLQRLYKELIMFNSNGLNGKLKELFKEDTVSSI